MIYGFQGLSDLLRWEPGARERAVDGKPAALCFASFACRPNPMFAAAFGEHVGIAQRMESVAPPGGVAVSESTARLVENTAVLAEPELVHIKGTDVAVLKEGRILSITGFLDQVPQGA